MRYFIVFCSFKSSEKKSEVFLVAFEIAFNDKCYENTPKKDVIGLSFVSDLPTPIGNHLKQKVMEFL